MKQLLTILFCITLVTVSSAGPTKSGGSSWSGGSSKPSTSSPSKPSPPKSSWSGGSSKPAAPSPPKSSWGGGSSNNSTKSSWSDTATKPSTTQISKKPTTSGFDTLARADAKKAESRSNYEKSTAPAPSYKTQTGKEVKLDPKDKKIDDLKRDLDQQKWVNRQQRNDTFYRTWVASPTYHPVYYTDPYHPALHFWLLSNSIDTMAMFVYHHQLVMDQARISAMYAQNSNLQARVAALEAQRLPRDPSWVPPGIERDLMYDDDYVDAVYNPQPTSSQSHVSSGMFWVGVWVVIKWIFWIMIYIFTIGVVIFTLRYLLFVKRWNY